MRLRLFLTHFFSPSPAAQSMKIIQRVNVIQAWKSQIFFMAPPRRKISFVLSIDRNWREVFFPCFSTLRVSQIRPFLTFSLALPSSGRLNTHFYSHLQSINSNSSMKYRHTEKISAFSTHRDGSPGGWCVGGWKSMKIFTFRSFFPLQLLHATCLPRPVEHF